MVSHIHSLRLQKIFRPANSHPTVLCFGSPRSRFASVHLDAGSYQRLHTSILLIVFYFLELPVASCYYHHRLWFDVHADVSSGDVMRLPPFSRPRHPCSLPPGPLDVMRIACRTWSSWIQIVRMRLYRGTLTVTRRLTVRKNRLNGVYLTWMDSEGTYHSSRLVIVR